MNTIRLKIAKLSGATDTSHIEKALEAVPGVKSVKIELAENQAIIDHEGADEQKLTTAVKQQGYVATID